MKKLILVAIVAGACLLASCGVSRHLTQNVNMMQTNVELSQKNYNVIGNVSGTAEAGYVFGIGGLSRKAIEANATAEMMKSANLTGAQAIVNPTTEIKYRGFAPFYVKVAVTSHGQVVEFTK